MAEQTMQKNLLQEYAQRATIPLPIYETVNEASEIAPQFRATVQIDGASFMSSRTFPHRKAAEQDVARVALESISRKIEDEGDPLIHNETFLCKSILHEYAVKMYLDKPNYITSQLEGQIPLFMSSVSFAGTTYIGQRGRTKKEAEQLGAKAVIKSILGSSSSRTVMSGIIKSKGRFFPPISKGSETSLIQCQNVVMNGHTENNSTNSVLEGHELPVASPVTAANAENVYAFPVVKQEHACELDSPATGTGASIPAVPQGDASVESTSKGLETGGPNLAHCGQVTQIPTVSLSALPTDSEGLLPNNGGKCSKKKKKRKPSKKARTD